MRQLLAATAAAALAFASQPAASAIVSADVGSNLVYVQTGSATYEAFNGGVNAFFFGRVFYPDPADFDGGTIQTPGGAVEAFNLSGLLDCCGNNGRGFQTGYLTPSDLATLYPSGSGAPYVLTATNSVTLASETVEIDLTEDFFTSEVPLIDDVIYDVMALGVNPNTDLFLGFNLFTPASNVSFAQTFVSVYNADTFERVFATVGAVPFGAALVPESALAPGKNYFVELIFDQGVTGDYQGVPFTARSNVRTNIYFQTTMVPEPGAWLLMIAGLGATGFALRRRPSRLPA